MVANILTAGIQGVSMQRFGASIAIILAAVLIAALFLKLPGGNTAGLRQFRRGHWERAKAYFSMVAQKEPRNVRALVYLAASRYYLGEKEEALDTLAEAGAVDPGYWPVYDVLKVINSGQWEKFNKTLPGKGNLDALGPDAMDDPAVTWAVVGAYEEGRLEEVIRFYGKGARREGAGKMTAPAIIAAAWAYYDSGEKEKGRAIIEALAQESPGYAPAHLQLALMYDLSGEMLKARIYAEKGIKADPGYGAGYAYRGYLLQREGKGKEAIAEVSRGLTRDPLYSYGYIRLGNILAQEHRYIDALRLYRQALLREPRNAMLYLLQGNAQYYMEDFAGAIKSYRKSLELGMDKPEVHYYLGHVLAIIDKVDEARLSFIKAARLDPKGPYGQRALAALSGYGRVGEKLKPREIDI